LVEFDQSIVFNYVSDRLCCPHKSRSFFFNHHNQSQTGEKVMKEETREQIALKRYQLISPIIAEPERIQNEYFRGQVKKEHEFPHYGFRKFKVSTFKRWLKLFRKRGYEGLKPKFRKDIGRPRRVNDEIMAAIRGKCKAFPNYSGQKLYDDLKQGFQLGDPPICYNTLLRIISNENLLPKRGRRDVRKRFEMENFGDLWLCDFMHGPQVMENKSKKKAILCAIIDDHSRIITGFHFNTNETISALTVVMKEAFAAYGVPKRFYVDNGSTFCSNFLVKACALSGVSLIHSKPYDSPSRGKVERFFRRVRQQFLPGLMDILPLDELNEVFSIWINQQYHQTLHKGINARPIDRYHDSVNRVNIRRFSKTELDEIFLVYHQRVVNNDATISFKGKIYEVPGAYIRQRVEIRHTVDDAEELFLYDNGARIMKLNLVDAKENSRTFSPKKVDTPVSFAKGRVMK